MKKTPVLLTRCTAYRLYSVVRENRMKNLRGCVYFLSAIYADMNCFPKYCAVFRRKDTGKRYGVLMLVNAEKIGIYSKKSIDVFNLRGEPEFVLKSVGKVGYFPG